MFALKSLTAVVALDLNFDWAEQKIQDAKIHSLDKETRGKTKKKRQKIERKICVDVCLAMGAKRFMRLPSGKCHRRLRQTHTHTYSSIMQMPQWKIFLWHLWRRTHFRWQQVERTAPCRTDQAKNGFKFTRQQEMGTRQGRTRGGEMGAQQQLSRNDVECVCVWWGWQTTRNSRPT